MIAPLNAAINVKARLGDKELHRWLPFQKVKQVLLERCRRPSIRPSCGLVAAWTLWTDSELS